MDDLNDLNRRILKGIGEARNGLTKDLGDFSEYLESDPNELCRCGHAARVHTLGSGNCVALGVTTQEDSHCLEFFPFAMQVKTIGEQIAYNIRAELVCCDIYGQVHDREGITKAAKTVLMQNLHNSPGWHDICFWGEAAARLAEAFR